MVADQGQSARIILASSSPRRIELMQRWGVPFESIPANIDETALEAQHAALTPDKLVRLLAEHKALHVSRQFPDAWVLGADTLVEVRGRILGKPVDEQDAYAMLRFQSGVSQHVQSAVALARDAKILGSHTQTSLVHMRELSDAQIWEYIKTEKPFDKAGAYAIQEGAGKFIAYYEGCYNGIIGLPLCRVFELLSEHDYPGVSVLPKPPHSCYNTARVAMTNI